MYLLSTNIQAKNFHYGSIFVLKKGFCFKKIGQRQTFYDGCERHKDGGLCLTYIYIYIVLIRESKNGTHNWWLTRFATAQNTMLSRQ